MVCETIKPSRTDAGVDHRQYSQAPVDKKASSNQGDWSVNSHRSLFRVYLKASNGRARSRSVLDAFNSKSLMSC